MAQVLRNSRPSKQSRGAGNTPIEIQIEIQTQSAISTMAPAPVTVAPLAYRRRAAIPSTSCPISKNSDGEESTTQAALVSDHSSSSSCSTSSSRYQDQNTMTGAESVPTACNSSIGTDENSLPECSSVLQNGSVLLLRSIHTNTSHTTTESELARIQELEQKRLALRHQRFSLEQRLYEFVGKHTESPPLEEDPACHVQDWAWKDEVSGLRLVYTGPLNEFDQPHGPQGKLQFADGQVFVGDVRNGLRAGQGRNSWSDGQNYVGEWKSNSRNGRGTHIWPDGRKVSGMWQQGHLNGKVYFSWPNGATYDGLVRKGKKHGRGVHTWADGRVYSGSFENGKEHGFGTLSHPDGVKYRGQFGKGVKNGYGIMLWKTRTYDGEWVQNKPEGQGRVVWSNGAIYTGQFKEGKYHGLGVYVWPSGKKFVGRWGDGVKNGHGLYTWPNGKKYDGEYKNGLKDGYGRMTWPDGQTYCGAFQNNKRFGRGVQSTVDGDIIHCGMWKDDMPLGGIQQVRPIPESVTAAMDETVAVEDLSLRTERDISSPNMVVKVDDLSEVNNYSFKHERSMIANQSVVAV